MGVNSPPQVSKRVEKDIPELGVLGLKIIHDIGRPKSIVLQGCTGCAACIKECPENALHIMEKKNGKFGIKINLALCNGVACRRCETVCNEKVFDLVKLMTSRYGEGLDD